MARYGIAADQSGKSCRSLRALSFRSGYRVRVPDAEYIVAAVSQHAKDLAIGLVFVEKEHHAELTVALAHGQPEWTNSMEEAGKEILSRIAAKIMIGK